MADNSSSHQATRYDLEIAATLPHIDLFHQATMDVIRAVGGPTGQWLDTGCGTGTLCAQALGRFPDTWFTLADPSEAMLDIARRKLAGQSRVSFHVGGTGSLAFPDGSFDVVTAIQCHHYLDRAGREAATRNCWRMLRSGGVYVEFENVRPASLRGVEVGMTMWRDHQMGQGRTARQVADHLARFDAEYFPISIPEHLQLLDSTGFQVAEVLWASVMQAGFYAIK
ncbi:MAG: methyltransferase domain-containing protein [Propionibacteriaceae bacterium]|nr:methyltransferase domain-containing protein [Propionibacteriaceae bacterium]